jgi:hypothetical protein
MILKQFINTKWIKILKQVFTFRLETREYFDLLEMAFRYRGSAFKAPSSARCVLRNEHGINDKLQVKATERSSTDKDFRNRMQ